MLDCLDLDLVRRILPLTVSERLLQPLGRVQGNGVASGPKELVKVLHKVLAAGKQPSGEPHKLPAALFRQPVSVLCKLLHYLTVNLVT